MLVRKWPQVEQPATQMTSAAEPPTLMSPTTSRDFAALANLATELAAYHGDRHEPAPAMLERDHGKWYEARLSRTAEGRDVGFVTWHRFYVSECAERGIEIRNLFVRADVRGCGIGRELFRAAAHAAYAADCQRLRLSVRKDNALGIRFYKQFGGAVFDMGMSWGYRWSRDGIIDLMERT
jgi:ribosomal protein S18 acetylase RimI-like enzyme